MRVRTIFCLFIVGALLHSEAVGIAAVSVPVQPAPDIALGYGAADLTPISQGVPIYTVNDTLWLASYYATSIGVTVQPPNSLLVSHRTADPTTPLPLYTFVGSDSSGTWQLLFSTPTGGQFVVPFQYVGGGASIVPTPTNYSITNSGSLVINFKADIGTAYQIKSCVLGAGVPNVVNLDLPSDIGNGKLGLLRQGVDLTATLSGSVSKPFILWLELYHQYSYSLMNSDGLVARDVLSASSTPTQFSPSSVPAGFPLLQKVGLRTGRYTLRTFFRSASGLEVEETSVLLPDQGSWLWLGGCTATSDVASAGFSTVSSLTAAPGTWPRELLMMYRVDGVEMFASRAIDLEPVVLNVASPRWLGEPIDIGVSASQTSGNALLKVVNTTIYIVAKNYPLQLVIRLSFGNETFSTITTQVVTPFSSQILNVSLGKLTVQVRNGDRPAIALVKLSDGAGGSAMKTTDSRGATNFFVPAGNYSVVTSYNGTGKREIVTVRDGASSSVLVDFAGSGSDPSTFVLVAAGVAGSFATLLVWLWPAIKRSRYNA
ncbi:MAG: hypothetical protein OK422_04050 [Thaumarchaeota archaeon]|nr:hypothetical protein [Nitrososphaerota archaeon]